MACGQFLFEWCIGNFSQCIVCDIALGILAIRRQKMATLGIPQLHSGLYALM